MTKRELFEQLLQPSEYSCYLKIAKAIVEYKFFNGSRYDGMTALIDSLSKICIKRDEMIYKELNDLWAELTIKVGKLAGLDVPQ